MALTFTADDARKRGRRRYLSLSVGGDESENTEKDHDNPSNDSHRHQALDLRGKPVANRSSDDSPRGIGEEGDDGEAHSHNQELRD